MKKIALLIAIVFLAASCGSKDNTAKKSIPIDSTAKIVTVCDSASIDNPSIKNYKKSLAVWLEDSSLDWFLEKRQMAWREAIAWSKKIFPVDSNALIKCIGSEKRTIFLYIPNHFFKRTKNGNEFFTFYIANNSSDTVLVPRIDAVINNISSSVSFTSASGSVQQWLSFQQTSKIVECGNSFWTMKLPPKTVIESQIESDFLNLGDTAVNYRLELVLGNRKIISNPIKIHLMKQQVPYLGKSFQ